MSQQKVGERVDTCYCCWWGVQQEETQLRVRVEGAGEVVRIGPFAAVVGICPHVQSNVSLHSIGESAVCCVSNGAKNSPRGHVILTPRTRAFTPINQPNAEGLKLCDYRR